MKIKNADIYTNAVDLAKKILRLNKSGFPYEISIVRGIANEEVVKVEWIYVEED